MAAYRSGVYEIRNITNGHRYIGSSVSIPDRFCGHRCGLRRGDHPNHHLQSAYLKYREESFVCSPLLYCDPENVLLYEQMCIDGLKPEYNMAKYAGAPMRGRFFSEEAKKKLSEMRMGHTFSEEARQKISESHMGIKPSDDTRRRLSESHIGKPSGHKGKTNSAETRQKISNANKGQVSWTKGIPLTPEVKEKLSKAMKGRIPWNKGMKLVDRRRGDL